MKLFRKKEPQGDMIRSYAQMPLRIYEQITELTERKLTENELSLSIYSLLSGKSEDEILAMPLSELGVIRDAASFLLYLPELPKDIHKEYIVGDFCLIPLRKASELTTAQFYDFTELTKGKPTTAEILSVFLIPKGCDYNEGYEIDEVRTAINEHLSCLDSFALRNFFTASLVKSQADFLSSLTEELPTRGNKEMTKELNKARKAMKAAQLSLRNGDGLDGLMRFPLLPIQLGKRFL